MKWQDLNLRLIGRRGESRDPINLWITRDLDLELKDPENEIYYHQSSPGIEFKCPVSGTGELVLFLQHRIRDEVLR